MTADTRHLTDLCAYSNRLTKQFNFGRTFDQGTAKRSDCLIPNKQNRIVRIPQIMFQMMFDSAGIAHTARGNDNLAVFVKVDRFGIIAGNGSPESREHQRVDALLHQCHRFFIKAVINMFIKDRRCFICQRTVYIDFEVIVSMHASFFLDLTDKIQHFLCTANCKRRNDYTSSTVKGMLDHFGKHCHIIRSVAVTSVTVSGFHDYIICIMEIDWIFDQWLIQVTDIAGEDYFLFFVIFLNDDLNARRSKEMSGIYETYADSLSRFNGFFVRTRNEVLNDTHGIFHGVCRNKFRFSLTTSFTVTPLCLEHLNVGTVSKHNVTKVAGSLCCINRALKTFCINSGKISGVIHMCMGQKNKIQVTSLYRNILILVVIRPLFHTAVYQEFLSCCFQIITASGYFMCRPNKGNLHVRTPFV